MASRALVLDANILIRAGLGKRVRHFLQTYSGSFSFFVPEIAYGEAEEHLARLVVKRGGNAEIALASLRAMAALGTILAPDVYCLYEGEARRRLAARDPDDWPILASALALGCPIWTEDADFLGCGVAVWTSSNIEILLSSG